MSEHDRWAEDVPAYLLGALPPEDVDGFRAHLAECAACRRDVQELQAAADALPIGVQPVVPPPALKERIMTVVRSEAELLAAAGEGADRPPARAAEPARRERRRSFGAWLTRPGVALACALVLLALGGLGGALIAGGGGPQTRTVAATTRAPDAKATLQVRDGNAMLLASNMPQPPSGRVYQVWVKRPGRNPEPTNVLWLPRGDGSAEVAVPGSVDGLESVLVTDEPAGGSATPTRPPVISASPA
jgi:anti-sigma factor RsiW